MASARANRTPKKRAAFLEALVNSGNVTAAAAAADIPRSTLYDWRAEDDQFAAEWDKALDLGADALEDEAIRRAFAGSDTLLIFLLKGIRPEKYKERTAVDHTGTVTHRAEDLSDEELVRIAAGSSAGTPAQKGRNKGSDSVH